MANNSNPPRKFSEKIAILNKNQQEGDIAFQKILIEMGQIVRIRENSLKK